MAERQVGRLVSEMQEAGTLAKRQDGRPKKASQAGSLITLEDVGLNHNQSSRYQREAKLAEEDAGGMLYYDLTGSMYYRSRAFRGI